MISKKKLEEYLLEKRSIVLTELSRESENNKKIALYAMLGTIDTFIEDLRSGRFDSDN